MKIDRWVGRLIYMELKKIILIQNGKSRQMDSKEEVIEFLFGDNYYNLSLEERKELIKLNTIVNTINLDRKLLILDNKKNTSFNLDTDFIVYDEVTYLLSLLMLNKCMLLEKKDSNIFTSDIDKSNILDNYIIVNTFAKELLKKYIERICKTEE